MTKEAFIASLRQLNALYGVPERVYTDNGSNFIGANKESSVLRELLCCSVTQDAIQHHLSFTKGLQWHFIPSRALWGPLGGRCESGEDFAEESCWESYLSIDEFQTLLFEASAVMNSRPQVPMDSQPADGIEPITPGQFLHDSGPTSLHYLTTHLPLQPLLMGREPIFGQ